MASYNFLSTLLASASHVKGLNAFSLLLQRQSSYWLSPEQTTFMTAERHTHPFSGVGGRAVTGQVSGRLLHYGAFAAMTTRHDHSYSGEGDLGRAERRTGGGVEGTGHPGKLPRC